MNTTTIFSFELFYSASATADADRRDTVMRTLDASLRALLADQDTSARIRISDSHKGVDNKIVEITTTLGDAALAGVLKQFCDTSGLTMNIVE